VILRALRLFMLAVAGALLLELHYRIKTDPATSVILVICIAVMVVWIIDVFRFYDSLWSRPRSQPRSAEPPPRAENVTAERPAREAPPRIGDDPFRDPPRPAPILAIRDDKPSSVPIVASSSDDEPEFLK
jgi:hypothetical protein